MRFASIAGSAPAAAERPLRTNIRQKESVMKDGTTKMGLPAVVDHATWLAAVETARADSQSACVATVDRLAAISRGVATVRLGRAATLPASA